MERGSETTMLKLVTLFCILVALCESKLEKAIEPCRAENGVTEDIAVILHSDMTSPMKCFIKCLYEKSGYLSDDGKILVDKMKADDTMIGEYKAREDEIYMCLEKLEFKSCDDAVQVNKCYQH